MYVCARLPPLCFFITPLCLGSLAAVQGVPGTDQVRAWDGGRSRKRSGGKRWIYYPQLTSSYCIKLPWTISKGLAEQNKQSGFIKKGLGGVGGRQRWHPSRGRISSMSPPTLSVLRAWGLQPPPPHRRNSAFCAAPRLQSCTRSWICLMMGYEYVCRLTDVLDSNCDGRGKSLKWCASWELLHVSVYNIMSP